MPLRIPTYVHPPEPGRAPRRQPLRGLAAESAGEERETAYVFNKATVWGVLIGGAILLALTYPKVRG